jgi:hypothetical protein
MNNKKPSNIKLRTKQSEEYNQKLCNPINFLPKSLKEITYNLREIDSCGINKIFRQSRRTHHVSKDKIQFLGELFSTPLQLSCSLQVNKCCSIPCAQKYCLNIFVCRRTSPFTTISYKLMW